MMSPEKRLKYRENCTRKLKRNGEKEMEFEKEKEGKGAKVRSECTEVGLELRLY